MTDRDDHYLTVHEAAKEARVSEQTIYRWIKSGAVSAVKIGGTIRIDRKKFRQLLSGDTQ
tara:strand:- start:356 stop:535 length:180 start_codon:yes stop_codon:yes gene_type:complete